jgi:16S rRNA (cytidine1402-2'-O)-methyltransferase
MSTLYVVATPIGNLADITLRALEILRGVDCVVCENPLVTKRLFARHGIPMPRMFRYSERDNRTIPALLRELKGKQSALVVNAGTPAISDPGAAFVAAARKYGFSVIPVPGPSAFVAALSIAGISAPYFTFLGFLPKKQRALLRLLEDLAARRITGVAYESPHRIRKTLATVAEKFPAVPIFAAKELTKIHEATRRGTAGELLAWLETPQKARGEFVLVFDFSRSTFVHPGHVNT